MHSSHCRPLALVLAAVLPLLLWPARAPAADGAALYQASCAACHGQDGKADSPTARAMKVPPLAGTTLGPEDVAKFVKASERHKAVRAKLSDDDLLAIAKALPGR